MKAKKTFSIALAAMLVLSLLPVGYALPPMGKVEERYKVAKANYLKALEAYKGARQDYLKMREMAKREPKGVTFDKAKNFLLRSIDAMVAHLEMVKARVDIARALSEEEKAEIAETLDSYISYLEEKKQEAEQAGNREELVSTAKDVREKWKEARVEIKKITGKIIISRIDRVLERGEEIGEKLESRIDVLKQEGYDTTELEALLADYMEHLSLAREKRDKAKEKFAEISSPEDAHKLFREANAFIREANRHMREMFKDLKQILREMKKAELEIKGIGFLYAKGNGSAVIQGNGSVFVKGEGNLTVKVANGTVRVAGEGEKQENSDGSVTYLGFGRARISGRDLYVSVEGTNLEIRARGVGVAILSGEGTYRTAKAEADWSAEEVAYGGAQK
jgi:hypothetical protein